MGQIGDYLADVIGPETPEETQARVQRGQSIAESLAVPENAPILNPPEFLQPKDGVPRGPISGKTLEEKAADLGFRPDAGSRITDPEEIARLQNTPEGIGQSPSGIPRPGADVSTMRGPTAEDIRRDQAPSTASLEEGMGEGLLEGFQQKGASARDQLTDTPTQAEIEAGVVDPVEAGKEFADKVVVGMQDAPSQTEANNIALEAGGVKEPDEKLTLEDRYDRNMELYKQIFNEDPEEDKKIDGYNLAMMGFLIASGDSPNALQNIAKGAAAGTDNFRKTAQARRDRKEKIKTFALQNALDSENAELQWEREMDKFNKGLQFKWLTTLRGEQADKEILAARIAAQRSNLITELAAEREESERTTKAVTNRALIDNFGPSFSAAVYSVQREGLDWTDPSVFEKEIVPRARRIAQSLPESSIDYEAIQSPQEYVLKNTKQAIEDVDTQDFIARQIGVEPGQLTVDQIRNFYINERDRTVQALASGAAPVQISTKKERDALPSGTEYIDPEGNRGVKR